jgi:hypothetical protein
MIIYANFDVKKFTFDRDLALRYHLATGNPITTLKLARVDPDAYPTPPQPEKDRVYVVMNRAIYDTIVDSEGNPVNQSRYNAWVNAGFDTDAFDTHRMNNAGTQAIFKSYIYDLDYSHLDAWVGNNLIVGWFFQYAKYDDENNLIKEGILPQLNTNPNWNTE